MKETAAQEKAWIELVPAQCAFLRAFGWDHDGSGLWAPPEDKKAFTWDLDHAVLEQNVRRIRGDANPAPPPEPGAAEIAFRSLSEAVRGAAGLEGYRGAHATEIDEAAKTLREKWVAFLSHPTVRKGLGLAADEAVKAITNDAKKCGNCGKVLCENPECEDA